MDQLLQMIQSADPTDNQSDAVELLQLEGKVKHPPYCTTLLGVCREQRHGRASTL